MLKRILILSIIPFLLISCGALTDKNYVEKHTVVNKHGEKIHYYNECNVKHLTRLDEYCYREVVVPKYCYYTLGKVVCYDEPLGKAEEVRRVK